MRQNRSYFDPTDDLSILGIARPTGVDDALGSLAALTAIAHASPEPADFLDLTPEKVAEVVDQHARAIVARDHVRTNMPWLTKQTEKRVRRAYLDAAADLIDQLHALAAKHLAVILTAAKHLRPDDTAESVVERGGEALKLWRKREEIDTAAMHLDLIADVTDMLARAIGRLPGNAYSHPWVWFTKVDTDDQASALQHIFSKADGVGGGLLAAAHAGHALTFAKPEDVAARSAAILASRDKPAIARQQAAEREAAANRAEGQRWVDAAERVIA